MTQTTIFDIITAVELGNRGVELAAENRASAVWDARQIAIEIGRRQRYLSMNDVNRKWVALGRRREELQNGSGAVFKSKDFRDSGRSEKAEHIQGHGRRLTVWEYLGE